MKKRLIPLVFISGAVLAQERTTASGGEATGSGGSVAFTVGVPDYTNHSGTNGSVTLGVQQPYELFSASLEEWNEEWDISVFPNPFTTHLTVQLPENCEKAAYIISDEQGRTVESGELSLENQTIHVSNLAMASYHLAILVNSNQVRKYHLIKNN